ncbi:hypothetical protein LguiA_017419 [Lonicera macranthoides]
MEFFFTRTDNGALVYASRWICWSSKGTLLCILINFKIVLNTTEASLGLFNPVDKKLYEVDFPKARLKLFKRSSYGWVVTIEDVHYDSPTDMYLINQLTKAELNFPQEINECNSDGLDCDVLLCVRDSHCVSKTFTGKVVLSPTPCDDNCIVVAIYGPSERPTYCNCNDKRTPLNVGKFGIGVTDVIFYKVTRDFDYSGIIIKKSDNPLPATNGFKVYKLEFMDSNWVQIHNTGDDILFWGFNSSSTISSQDLPGYKGNYIYFTDFDYSFNIKKGAEEDSDVGVFNFEDGDYPIVARFYVSS